MTNAELIRNLRLEFMRLAPKVDMERMVVHLVNRTSLVTTGVTELMFIDTIVNLQFTISCIVIRRDNRLAVFFEEPMRQTLVDILQGEAA